VVPFLSSAVIELQETHDRINNRTTKKIAQLTRRTYNKISLLVDQHIKMMLSPQPCTLNRSVKKQEQNKQYGNSGIKPSQNEVDLAKQDNQLTLLKQENHQTRFAETKEQSDFRHVKGEG